MLVVEDIGSDARTKPAQWVVAHPCLPVRAGRTEPPDVTLSVWVSPFRVPTLADETPRPAGRLVMGMYQGLRTTYLASQQLNSLSSTARSCSRSPCLIILSTVVWLIMINLTCVAIMPIMNRVNRAALDEAIGQSRRLELRHRRLTVQLSQSARRQDHVHVL